MVANFDDFEKSCHFSNIKFFFFGAVLFTEQV